MVMGPTTPLPKLDPQLQAATPSWPEWGSRVSFTPPSCDSGCGLGLEPAAGLFPSEQVARDTACPPCLPAVRVPGRLRLRSAFVPPVSVGSWESLQNVHCWWVIGHGGSVNTVQTLWFTGCRGTSGTPERLLAVMCDMPISPANPQLRANPPWNAAL